MSRLTSFFACIALLGACSDATGPPDSLAGDVPQQATLNTVGSVPLYAITVVDPLGDALGDIDLRSLQMDFDPATGAYAIRIIASRGHPFHGNFRINLHLLNIDRGSVFSDAVNDFDLASNSPGIVLTGFNSVLEQWQPGDEAFTNSLCNFGPDPRFFCSVFNVPNPPGTSLFRSSVTRGGFLTNEDMIAFHDHAQTVTVMMLTVDVRLTRIESNVLFLLEEGALSQDQVDGLEDKLVEIRTKLAAGKIKAAQGQLAALKHQIRGFAPVHLTSLEADLLTGQIDELIACLS